MGKRVRVEDDDEVEERKDNYFTSKRKNLEVIKSGCTLLDCALGCGGWVRGRMVNIVGDKSTAKTGLVTEAIINFKLENPEGVAAYRESEGAWDDAYAEAMGAPIEDIDFGENEIATVEDFERDLSDFTKARIEDSSPSLYALDSMDALSDEAEQKRDIGKGSYGAEKAKQNSQLFRKLTKRIEKSNCCLMIVSQVRDNIGVSFGKKHLRSGGHALDFYGAQVVWLAHVGILKKTIKKVEKPYGIAIRAKVEKNKVGLPFRECNFNFIFGYGVDDAGASIEWLKKVNRLKDINLTEDKIKKFLNELEEMSPKEYRKENKRISKVVTEAWAEIEDSFLPKRKKYT